MVILLPLGGIFKRSLSVLALVILKLGQDKRKLIIIKYVYSAVLGVNHRNRLAPVALTCEYPLSEMVVCGSLGNAHLFKLYSDGFLSLFNGKTCELLGVDKSVALSEVIALFKSLFGNVNVSKLFIAVDYLYHVDIVSNSVLKVSLVMGRYCHYRTCAVACKNEVADEHSYFLAVYGIYAGNALKLAA